nr:wnt family protein [Polaribacter porphyrae]
MSAVFATLQTLKIAQKEFPNIHGNHNKANAFRHALWNILIAKKCRIFSDNLNKVVNWTTTFTDWHEDFVINDELPRLMDLHNNAVGRKLFLAWKDEKTKTIAKLLKMELTNAKLIITKEGFNGVNNNSLVFLE